MKTFLLSILFIGVFFLNIKAQTFTAGGGSIPDNGTSYTCFPISVTGIGSLSSSNGLTSVCLNISHTYVSELTFYLQSPDGSKVELSSENGSSYDNYTNTCFKMNAPTLISSGVAPFTGDYRPEGNLGYFNNGSSANGTWYLCIIDWTSGDIGTVNSISLSFGNSAPAPPAGCGNNPMAADFCSNAVPICDLNGYCGITSPFYDNASWSSLSSTFCGTIENNSFLTFVASASSISLNVVVSNCTYNDGIQFLIFSSTGTCSGTVTSFGCDGSMSPGTNTVNASGLTPGNTYYLMIDGYAGDVCDYVVSANSGVQTVSISSTGGSSICSGSSTTLSIATIGAGPFTYNWTNGATSIGSSSSVTVSPSTTTTYTCTVNGACGSSKTAYYTVNVYSPSVSVSPSSSSICPGGSVNLTSTSSTSSTQVTRTFNSGNLNTAIPDNNATGISNSINLSGYLPTLLSSGTLVSVTVNINHPYDGDLDIFLISPGGTTIELSTDNGGTGDNYVNTIFNPNAGTAITAGSPPFTGTFRPEGTFTSFNGQNLNGNWTLKVADDGAGDIGTLVNWSITFLLDNSVNSFVWSPTSGLSSSTVANPTASPASSTTYTLTITDLLGCTKTANATVNVSSAVVGGTIATSTSYCTGSDPVALTSSTSGSGGTGTSGYQWQQSTDGGVTWTNITGATAATFDPGVITTTTLYRRVYSNTCGSANSNTVTLTVYPVLNAGTIGSNQTVCNGGDPANITFNTNASGGNGPYSYQWQSSPDNATWTDIAGANTNSYDHPNGLTSIKYIRVRVTDACGTVTFANVITLNVYAALSGGTIATAQTICSGSTPATITSSAAASGGTGATTYQWQSSPDGVNWTNIPGATGATYSPASLSTTTYYRRVASNTCGSVNSNSIIITVNPLPSVSSVPKTDVTICGGNNGTITINASGSPTLNYSINGGTTYQVSNSFTNLTQGTYTVIVRDGNSCTYSWGQVSITNGSAPSAPTATSSVSSSVCNGSAMPTFTVSNAGYSYNWWSNSGLTIAAPGTNNTTSYTPVAPAAGSSATYYVTATTGGCQSAATAFTISVYSNVSAGGIGSNQTICSGQDPVILSELTPASGGNSSAGYTYQWEMSTNGGTSWSDIPGATGVTYDPPVLTTTTLYRRKVTNTCGTSVTSSVTVTVNPNPTVAAVSDVSACPGATISAISFNSSVGGSTFSWTASGSFSTVGLSASSGVGSIPSWTAPVNNTGSNFTSQITVIATAAGCSGASVNFNIIIKPTPVVNSLSDVTVCPSEIISIGTFSSSPAGGSFNWSNNNTAIGISASGTGSIPNWNAPSNSTGSSISGTISYTTTLNGCVSNPKTVNVTIKPTPAISSISNQSYCPGNSISNQTFTTTPSGATINWTNSNTSIGIPASGSGNINGWTAPSNASGSNYSGTISATPSLNGCTGSNLTYTITIKPIPVLNSLSDVYACPGSSVNVPAFNSNPAGTYAWTNNNTSIGLGVSGSGSIPSFTAGANSSGINNSASISVTATANGCTGSSGSFQIYIYPTPIIDKQPDIAVCPGQTTIVPAFNTNPFGSSFSWTNTNTAIGLGASGNGNIGSFISGNNNTNNNIVGSINVSAQNNGCQSSPMAFNIIIKPKPTLTALNNETYCPNTNANIPTFSTTPSGGTFNWLNDNTTIGLGASGAGNIPSFITAANNSGTNNTSTIKVTGEVNGCNSDTGTFTITISPTPALTSLPDISSCPGGTLGPLNFTSNPGGATVDWTNSNSSINQPLLGNGNIISWTAPNNNSGSSIVSNIIATPTLAGCKGRPDTIVVSVYSQDNASVTYPTLTACITGSNPIPSSIAQPGGTFSISGGATINSSTGEIDLSTTTAGTTYVITYTTSGTCPSTRNYNLTVSSSSISADFTIASVVCNNDPNQAPVYINGGTAGSFTIISGGNGLVIDASGVIYVGASTPGTYTIQNTIPASGGCAADSAIATIQIKAKPDAGFTGLAAQYCNNASNVSIVPNLSGGTFSGNGVSGTIFSPSNSNIGLNTITHTISLNGCTDSSSQIINVFDKPNVLGVASDDTICIGESITLNGFGTQSYTWNNGVTNGVAFNPSSSNSYIVTGTDGNNCSNKDTVNIIVNALPTLSTNDIAICRGSFGNLTVTGNAASYSWSNGQIGNSISVSPNNTITYYVTGESAQGCILTDSSIVTVNNLPGTTLSAAPSQICAGNSTSITASGNATSYSWIPNGSSLGQINVTLTNDSTFTIVGQLGNCTDTARVNVNIIPNPNVLVDGDPIRDTTICFGANITVNASGGTTYSWSNGNLTNGISINPTSNTSYTVIGNSSGCMDTAIVNVSVNPPIQLNVSNATICSGNTATIVASGASTYTWSNSSTNDTLSLVIFSPGTYTYTVTGTDGNNCVANGQGVITVNPKPSLNINDTTICSGNSATLTASGAVQYSWNTNALTPSINVSPTSTTAYTVIGTNQNNCTDTAFASVTVNNTPTATINNQTTFTSNVCENGTVTLTGAGAFFTSWSNGSTNTTIYPTVSTNSIYTLTVTDAITGCKDTALAFINTITPPNITVNNPSICPGSAATLTANGGVNYQWSEGTINDTLIVSPLITSTYTVEGSDANGCKNTAIATVTLLQNPTINAQGSTICKGETAIVSVSGNASSYTWDTGTIGTSISVNPLNSVVYTVTASNGSCTSTDTAIVNVLPVAVITSTGQGNEAKCNLANGSITNANVQNGQFIYWLDSNGNTVSTVLNPTDLAAGTYTLVAVSLDGCVTTATSNTIIGEIPKATASFTMTDSTGVVPLQVQFTNTSTAPTGVTITNYSWHFGDPSSTTTSVESPIFTYYFGDSQDTIRLIITDSNGCTDTAYKYVDLKEPLDSIFIPNVFSPNDDQKNDVFFVKSFLIKELNVVIFNRWGQLIYEWEGVNTGWDGRTTSGQLAPEGTYYYMIKGELKDGSEIPKRFMSGSVTLVR
jgi:gliding motility-associated-like protein